MKKKRSIWSVDVLIVFLVAACAALLVLLCIEKPNYIIPAALIMLALLLVLVFFAEQLRRGLRRFLGTKGTAEEFGKSGLSGLSAPLLVLSGKRIVWYNAAFCNQIAGGSEVPLLPLQKLVPGLDIDATASQQGQSVQLQNRVYTVYGSPLAGKSSLYFAVFVDDTELKEQAEELKATRPTVLYIEVDTYEEVLKDLREGERTRIMAEINLALERMITKTGGFLRRITSARHIAVIDEASLQKITENRFEILNTVRSSDEDASLISLSIGVGRGGKTLKESEDMAQQALSMALGRGGDQAAVKTPDGYEFYGGVSRSVEKRSRVKSRIIANSIKDLMKQVDRVLIMGHRLSDMDSVGAATGMLRFCKMCKKEAVIVLNTEATMATNLIDYLVDAGYGADIMSPAHALPLAGPRTLLVVVDTHMKGMLESEAVYELCEKVVVIDHHRKMVGHIDNAAVFYHEPYASSASELVSELLPYADETPGESPLPVDAEALLAGIMLDTRTFSLHVGVRTFEAAAYLRRLGAETETVKKLFASSLNEYILRTNLVEMAEIYENCAIVISEEIPLESEVVAPQAANDLLTIEGVQASVVAIKQAGMVRISARSMGEVNVQLIMEKLGGGGHLTMAGAQLKNTSLKDAYEMILDAIDAYNTENLDVIKADK
ncbi:DHH family phosphoesterase [Ruminococcaceae bacterium OttesenSCG-928-A16]|nr:DHH family phosphoesterase [Ruminococcaceae bacterium OttesenSCG-928-A16]